MFFVPTRHAEECLKIVVSIANVREIFRIATLRLFVVFVKYIKTLLSSAFCKEIKDGM